MSEVVKVKNTSGAFIIGLQLGMRLVFLLNLPQDNNYKKSLSEK